jgi:dihydrodipicolinate synthase/N-acetylneuraminate lyase
MRFKIEGIISAMVTPFTKGGEYVDFDKVAGLAQRMVKQGAVGLFPCGTTGEGMLMNSEERKEVLEEVISAVGKTAKVIGHTGTMELATTIELTRHAQESGACAAGIVAPFFYSFDEEAMFQYYKAIANSVKGFPILLYNIPGCAKNVLTPALVKRLANACENIVGIKDSGGNIIALIEMLGQADKGFHVINGVDDYGLQGFLSGCPAAVSGTSNVLLPIYVDVYKAMQKGNMKKAREKQYLLGQGAKALEYGAKTAIFKEGLRLQGFDAGYVRSPQRELSAKEKKQIAKRLEDLGII